MAAGSLPKPGTEYGPCEGGCKHTDCAETRKMAESLCKICNEPIGYDTKYYHVGEPGEFSFEHYLCAHEKADKE